MVEGRWVKAGLICGIVWLCLNEPCFAAGMTNKLGISLGTFGIGGKFKVNPQICTEVRYSLDSDLHIISGRGYYNLLKNNVFVPFIGMECGMINFDVDGIKGNGTLLNGFVGSEFFVTKNLAVEMDLGYGNLTLFSSGFSVSGAEWIFTTGVNYYFSFQMPKKTTAVKPSVSTVEVSSPVATTSSQSQPVTPVPLQPQTTSQSFVPSKNKPTAPKLPKKPLTNEEKEMTQFYFDGAKRLYLSKDYSGALEQFQQVLKYDPNHAESLKYIEECKKELKK